jgi:hypothetical protein
MNLSKSLTFCLSRASRQCHETEAGRGVGKNPDAREVKLTVLNRCRFRLDFFHSAKPKPAAQSASEQDFSSSETTPLALRKRYLKLRA